MTAYTHASPLFTVLIASSFSCGQTYTKRPPAPVNAIVGDTLNDVLSRVPGFSNQVTPYWNPDSRLRTFYEEAQRQETDLNTALSDEQKEECGQLLRTVTEGAGTPKILQLRWAANNPFDPCAEPPRSTNIIADGSFETEDAELILEAMGMSPEFFHA